MVMATGSFARKLGAAIHGEGDGTMLFLNGFGTQQPVWRHQLEHFNGRYRAVTFDYVGSGASDIEQYSATRYATLHDYADDVLGLIDELNLERLTLVGHSVGGTLGALVAIAAPEKCVRLVMIGSAPCYIAKSDYVSPFTQADADGVLAAMVGDYQAWATGYSKLVAANPDKPSVAEAYAAYLKCLRPDIAQTSLKTILNSDVRALLPRIGVPTLIIQASADIAVPREVALYMHAQIPKSELVEIAFAGHLPHMLAPDEMADLIDGFVTRP